MFKLLKLFVKLAALSSTLAACGSGNDKGETVKLNGPVIQGSKLHGMALALRAVDQTSLTSSVYYYNFSSGELRRVIASASTNPGLFYIDDRVFLFNRADQQKDFSSFDPNKLSAQQSDPIVLDDLTAGDPFDVAPLVTGKSLVLASLKANKLQKLDYETGELSSLSEGMQFSAQPFRPRALYRYGKDQLAVLQTGVKEDGSFDNAAQIYTGKLSGSSLQFDDEDASTPTIIDGLEVGPSNPSGFLQRDTATSLVMGLCPAEAVSANANKLCTAGATQLDVAATPKANKLATYGQDFPYHIVNQIIDGPDADSVYAHVQSDDEQYQVIRLNVKSKLATVVHTFPDERLYGIAYDSSTQTLLVGGHDGAKGELIVYRDDKEVERLDVDGFLYTSVAVPNVAAPN